MYLILFNVDRLLALAPLQGQLFVLVESKLSWWVLATDWKMSQIPTCFALSLDVCCRHVRSILPFLVGASSSSFEVGWTVVWFGLQLSSYTQSRNIRSVAQGICTCVEAVVHPFFSDPNLSKSEQDGLDMLTVQTEFFLVLARTNTFIPVAVNGHLYITPWSLATKTLAL